MSFEAGKKAALEGKARNSNPYICGVTKLGSVKYSCEEGREWDNGFVDGLPRRIASQKEMADWGKINPSRFKRKSNRYYQ